MPDDLEYPAPDEELSPSGRADPVGSEFLLREGSQARAGGSYSLSERLRRREAYHADDTARRTPRPRDRAVTTSHKIAEAMTEFVGPDGRTYAAIPMDLYAEVAEEEQEVPEEEYDAEAAFAAWTQLTEEQRIAQIEQAQAALDTLPGNDRAIMERIVLVAGNARAGLKTAAQRTRQYFTAGDQIIAQGQQHGATFTTESFEALLFAMDDTLKSRPSITSTQLEECDAVVLGHMAVLTTSGTPIMPDSFADFGNIFRTPVQSVGRFGIMTRDLDSEGNVRAGPWLWRNFRVAWRRYGPLVLLGLGWAWNPIYTRAEVLREMMTGTGAPAPARRLAQHRGLFWTATTAALTLLLLAAFISLTIFRGDLGRFRDNLGHGVSHPFGGTSTGSLCVDCSTVTAVLPTTTDGAAPTATPTERIIYQDALTASGSSTGWSLDSACAFKPDGLHVIGLFTCFAPPDALADGTVTVTVKPVSGATNKLSGIVFRRMSTGNYYLAQIDGLGRWSLDKVVNGAHTGLAALQSNPAIRTGTGASNTLTVQMVGGRFTIAANGTPLGSATDATFASGLIGLAGNGDGDVLFTHLTITAPRT